MSQTGQSAEQRALAAEKRRLTALTLVAALDAIMLTLISAQFVAPPVFIALLCVVPVIFSLQVLWAPLWVALESGALVTLVALALYGPVIGVWVAAYVITGLISGLGRKLRLPAPLRVVALTVTLVALVVGSLEALLWLGGISLAQTLALIQQWVGPLLRGDGSSFALILASAAAGGLVVVALILAVSIELFARAITRRLPFESLTGGGAQG